MTYHLVPSSLRHRVLPKGRIWTMQVSPLSRFLILPLGRTLRSKAVGLLLLCLLTCLPAPAQTSTKTVTVGSKRFAESRILGEILTQMANKVGEAKATHKAGLGNTGIVFAAFKKRQH